VRVRCPSPFSLEVHGPDGPYRLGFIPLDEWDGELVVEGLARPMRWSVLSIDLNEEGALVLSGTTDGSDAVWGDQYWFEARVEPAPASIAFWSDQVLVRTDKASAIGRVDTNS
jgi:hypothetical protein